MFCELGYNIIKSIQYKFNFGSVEDSVADSINKGGSHLVSLNSEIIERNSSTCVWP